MYKKEGIDWENLKERCRINFRNHPDGAGIMVRSHNGIVFKKGFDDWKSVYKYAGKIDIDTECAVHFRTKSDGKINAEMCHPFSLDDVVLKKTKGIVTRALMHNGIINPLSYNKSEYSDTYRLAKLLAGYTSEELTFDDRLYDLVKAMIGYDRAIIFTDIGTIKWGAWQEYKGIEYSNKSFKKVKRIYKTGRYFTDDYYLEKNKDGTYERVYFD
ncbi:MAG: hypothetical protein BAJALOKI1v1_2440002 [Promethearchaeota archaeon]|nr:MAG: hypothetical protein BAJALOKI1v1_2440002 [Candidatus Lokiarchaeota archaeon]